MTMSLESFASQTFDQYSTLAPYHIWNIVFYATRNLSNSSEDSIVFLYSIFTSSKLGFTV